MISSSADKVSGTISNAQDAAGPWTKGCATPAPLDVITGNGGEIFSGSYNCNGEMINTQMAFDPQAMTLSAMMGNTDSASFTCQWL